MSAMDRYRLAEEQKRERTRERMRGLPSVVLPTGRFVCRPADEDRFDAVGHPLDPRFWIRERDVAAAQSVGPLEPEDVLRALRLVNLEVPYGCDIMPWEDGRHLFTTSLLPDDRLSFFVVDPKRLAPSLSPYEASDIDEQTVDSCCAPSKKRPKVRLDYRRGSSDRIDQAFAAVVERRPELERAQLGVLRRGWNGHPAESLVIAPTGRLESGFFVADIP